MDWWKATCCNTDWPVLRQLQTWFLLWLILVTVGILAVVETTRDCEKYVVDTWHHKLEECNDEGPVLLSRAFTTLGWARGVAVGFALFSILIISKTPVTHGEKPHNDIYAKRPLSIALVIFSAAFLVNMFESSAHGILIGIGSVIAILFTCPGFKTGPLSGCYRENFEIQCVGCGLQSRVIWWLLWIFMVVNCALFLGFWADSCANGDLTPQRCPKLKSYWYITEYLFFWTMYLLVGYSIAMEEEEPYTYDEVVEATDLDLKDEDLVF